MSVMPDGTPVRPDARRNCRDNNNNVNNNNNNNNNKQQQQQQQQQHTGRPDWR
jgi:hypothetical protein